jgi:hypothetical protein
MPRDKVFVSYSHTDKSFLDELLPVLQAVPRIASNLWLDEQKIDIRGSRNRALVFSC